jgi:diacylglycerol kinase (ATP)
MSGGIDFGARSSAGHDPLAERPGAVIVNPASAGGATRRRWPTLEAILQGRGLRFKTHVTSGPGDAGALARRAREDGAEWIVCVGGDGTFNELVNGLADEAGRVDSTLAIGIVPSGTGLDLARNLGLPLNPEAAARVIGRGRRSIDLGRVRWDDGRRRLFANMAGAGFDAEVAARANALRRFIPGKLPYALGIFSTLPEFRPREVEADLERDQEPRRLQVSAMMVVACNGWSYGGGMKMAPGAQLDDGLLQVVAVEALPPLLFLARLPLVYWGAHLDQPGVHVLPARQMTVRAEPETAVQTDGELVGTLPATIEVVPGAVTALT